MGLTLILLLVYFGLLLIVGRATARKATNIAFYRGDRQSTWQLVAFGMIGASVSGVTFVSVPGMAIHSDMTYLQTCMGFILGYFIVAFVLLPVYYKMNLTTIYSYLEHRFGSSSRLTGAWFFLISKMVSTAVKFYVVCIIVHQLMFTNADGSLYGNASFIIVAVVMVMLVWLYSRRGGIKTLVWTDTVQTTCILVALVLIISSVINQLGMTVGEAATAVVNDSHSRIFVFDDWLAKQNFWKQFISGAFIVVVMTGLDQDMMQKNLTCKSLREAQKDMCSYGFAFLPANALFLVLGVLLMMLANKQGLAVPDAGDELLPMFAATGKLGQLPMAFFVLGIVAASFSSADSALTALTTSYCVDIRGKSNDENMRKRAHIMMAVVLIVVMLLFRWLNSTSVIDAIYILVGYTYGPLLGLFAFGLFTRRSVNDRMVPAVAIASPVLCYLIDTLSTKYFGYKFGYELLLLNGMLTFIGLLIFRKGK
ncbi:MAG: sodium:solute symporter [Prevotella sp.]|nr:sodium:solute symporter [Prevotella sp.]